MLPSGKGDPEACSASPLYKAFYPLSIQRPLSARSTTIAYPVTLSPPAIIQPVTPTAPEPVQMTPKLNS